MSTRVWQVYVHNVCMMVNVWGGEGGGECVGVVGVVVNVWMCGRHRHKLYTSVTKWVWQSGCGDVGVPK